MSCASSPGEYDRDAFESLAAEARQALEQGEPQRAAVSFSKALQLWRGPPFADFLYEPFAEAEIARLEEARLACLEDGSRPISLSAVTRSSSASSRRSPRSIRSARAYAASSCSPCTAPAARRTRSGVYQPGPSVLVERGRHRAECRRSARLEQRDSPPRRRACPADVDRGGCSMHQSAEAAPNATPSEAARKTVTVLVSGDAAHPTAPRSRPGAAPPARVTPSWASRPRCSKRHGAYVERLLDERVMGLFGIPSRHEDDALRAVRAAVELGEALAPKRRSRAARESRRERC